MNSKFSSVRLKDIATIYSGNSINEKVKEKKYTGLDSGVHYISTKDIGFDSKIHYDNGVKIPFEELDSFKTAPKNTVFICAEGGSAGRKIGISDRELCFVNKLLAVVAGNEVLPKYLFYFFKSDDFIGQFRSHLTGIIGGVSLNKFKELEIKLPPLATQHKIVTKLDAIFVEIDKAMASVEANVRNAESLFQSYLGNLFQDLFETCEIRLLVDVSNKISDGVHKKPNYTDSGIPFLKINNLTEGSGISFKNVSYISKEDHEEFKKRTHPEKGDILITKDGTIGVVRVIETEIEFSIFVSLALIKPKAMIDSYYLSFLLTSPQIQNLLVPQGAALKHIYLTDLRKLGIPVPPPSLQKKLTETLLNFSRAIEEIKTRQSSKLAHLSDLRISILKQAFNGELVKE